MFCYIISYVIVFIKVLDRRGRFRYQHHLKGGSGDIITRNKTISFEMAGNTSRTAKRDGGFEFISQNNRNPSDENQNNLSEHQKTSFILQTCNI